MLQRAVAAAGSVLLLLPAVTFAAGAPPPPAVPRRAARRRAIDVLLDASPAPAQLSYSTRHGGVEFFAPAAGSEPRVPARAAASAEGRARWFLSSYGEAFALPAAAGLRTERAEHDELGMDHVRFQQLHRGVPVTGAELIVHLRGDAVVAATARTSDGVDDVDVTPAIAAPLASATAAELMRRQRVEGAELTEPRLEVLDRGLLEGRSTPARLSWFVEARAMDADELIWVDATTGDVLLHFSQLADAKSRTVYTASGGSALPGTLLRVEGGPVTSDADANDAYDFAGITYDYYWAQHGRDSYDGAGAQLRSTVHYCPDGSSCPLQNAFWNGAQMVYGDGFAAADDVVAHELTHAVTGSTAHLYYYMQSGALNESFSDIFGETVDLTDGRGNDAPGARWQIAEDLPGGPFRNMMTPNGNGDPARVGDADYVCDGETDQGGVHHDSGVPNHAYALMVDGGTFNGKVVTGIGLTKAAKIEYRTLTRYLGSAAGFRDDADALYRSCMDLVGTSGITGSDCSQVKTAVDAVEMSTTAPCGEAAVPPLCPARQTAVILADTDFETGIGFTDCPADATPPSAFCVEGPTSHQGAFATSGTHSLWGDDPGIASDRVAWISWGGTLPAGARLQFNHAYGFDGTFDGGMLEYTIDAGASWHDASPLYAAGAWYDGYLDGTFGNPQAGRAAFVGWSWGYAATQLDLAALAGRSFGLRWRIATDSFAGEQGWFVDDVRIYQCASQPGMFSDGFETGNLGRWSGAR